MEKTKKNLHLLWTRTNDEESILSGIATTPSIVARMRERMINESEDAYYYDVVDMPLNTLTIDDEEIVFTSSSSDLNVGYSVYTVWLSNDETDPMLVGIATTEKIADQMVQKMEDVFEDSFHYSVTDIVVNEITVDHTDISFGADGCITESQCCILCWNDEYLQQSFASNNLYMSHREAEEELHQILVKRLTEMQIVSDEKEAEALYHEATAATYDDETDALHVSYDGAAIQYGGGYEERYSIVKSINEIKGGNGAMTIQEAIAKARIEAEEPLKKYSVVNVGFLSDSGDEDETQLNIRNSLNTSDGVADLIDLFDSLREELECSSQQGNILYVRVVATSDTEDIFDMDC